MASMKDIRKGIEMVDMDVIGEEYGYIGIRVQEEAFGLKVGDTVAHNSLVWVDGDETDEELDGVSAMDINHLDIVDCEYYGSCVLVLGSDCTDLGEDLGEIVMKDAKVLAIINL